MSCLEHFILLTSSSSLKIFPFIVSLMLPFLFSLLPVRQSPTMLLCSFLHLLVLVWSLLLLTSHSDLCSPCYPPPYTSINSWKIYFQPRWFIQQPITQVYFDLPHISKVYVIVPPPHLLLMYIVPQRMASTFTQETKPKLYSLSLVYSLPCLFLDAPLLLLPLVFHTFFSVSF